MKNNFLLLLIAIFGIQITQAQSSKVSNAYFYLSDYTQDKKVEDLQKAKEAIDDASINENTSLLGKTWYYKGLIYDLLSKDETSKVDGTDYSAGALDAYEKALTLEDKKFRDDDKVFQKLMELAVNTFNAGVVDYGKQEFTNAYNKFNTTSRINDLLKSNGEKEAVNNLNVVKNATFSAEYGGLYDETVASYEKLIPLDAEKNHYFNLAKFYQKNEKAELYAETLERGAKVFPDDANIIIEQLNILMKSGEMDAAMAKIDKAIELQPKNDMLYFVKGNTLDNAGKVDEAISLYKKTIEINPKNEKALFNIGAVYFKKANIIIEEMNSLTMSDADVKKYDQLNEERKVIYRDAKPYFEKVLEINPGDKTTQNALNKINSVLNK